MLKIKKILTTLIIAAATLLSVFAFMGLRQDVITYADSDTYLSDEIYTDSDALLNSDGDISYKNIQEFSAEVKAAPIGAHFPELVQVIPEHHLESSAENAIFQYNGKEYGFYVVKEGELFDILLIDFVYEFEDGEEHSDIEYKIRVKPLLQQTFKRTQNSSGEYIWEKAENNYTYYIANPRFLATVQNENALNYGDKNYSKQDDDGVIILQNRINYGKISYATEDDLIQLNGEIALDIVVDIFIDTADKVFFKGKGILGAINTYVGGVLEGINKYIELGEEKTIVANNEANIKTCNSKTEQCNNSQLKGYSRAIAFTPQDEIILSAADESYAESIVVLNDSNYKSRLTQICEFDIVRRSDNYSSMEYVAGNWQDENSPVLNFSKTRVLFEDQEPRYAFDEEPYKSNSSMPVYLLPNGSQSISFEPLYSGNYKFNIPADTQLAIENATASNGKVYYLKGGETYNIVLLNNSDMYSIISHVDCILADKIDFGNNAVTIEGGTEYIFELTSEISGYYKLSIDNSNISVYDGAVEMSDGNYYFYIEKGDIQYMILSNASNQDIDCYVVVSDLLEVTIENDIACSAGRYAFMFTNTTGYVTRYSLELNIQNGTHYDVSVYDEDGDLKSTLSLPVRPTYMFTLEANQTCYIVYNISKDCTFSINIDEIDWRWMISTKDGVLDDDIKATGYTKKSVVNLARGATYTIKLGEMNSEGDIIESSLGFEAIYGHYSGYVSYDPANNQLYIAPDTPTETIDGKTVEINLVAKVGVSLRIVITRNRLINIDLNRNGGRGGTDTFIYEIGQPYEVYIAPTRTGYTFNGYYTDGGILCPGDYSISDGADKMFTYIDYNGRIKSFKLGSKVSVPQRIQGGNGIQCINSTMRWLEAIEIAQIEDGTTLYACWVPNRYSITYNNFDGEGGKSTKYVFYSESYGFPDRPEKRGCVCLGFASTNGSGYFYYDDPTSITYLYNYTYNISFNTLWSINIEYLDIEIESKSGGVWSIKITNNMATNLTVKYNSKMCNYDDAKNWTGLKDIKEIDLEPYESIVVKISENWFATSITVSFDYGFNKYITYADQLAVNGSMSIHTNMISS